MAKGNKYVAIIERIFLSKFKKGLREIDFHREEIAKAARDLKIELPKNLGDVIYSFRYRATMPDSIASTAGEGSVWLIRPAGQSKYRFVMSPNKPLAPNESMIVTKVPDSTPGVIAKYALSDEQALLAKIRYNRLVDIFTGVACYSLQNHLRTQVPGMAQAETDEIYVGVDRKGVHYILPIQAKGGNDKLSIVQIEQDVAMCGYKFRTLICRPLAAQFMEDEVIAMFEFEETKEDFGISSERHYRLVPPEDVTESDLQNYRSRLSP